MPSHCRPPPPFTRIIDTGTSHHNLALGDGDRQNYVPYASNTPEVMIPNGDNITAHARYTQRLPNVSKQASEANILPSFKHSLISVGQLCDDDCSVRSITNTTNLSSQALEIHRPACMNRKSPYTINNKARYSKYLYTANEKTSSQTQLYQQQHYRNILNTYINVLFPQQQEPGSRQ